MMELPEVDELRVARFILAGRDPFAFGRKKHKKIKGMRVQKRKVRVLLQDDVVPIIISLPEVNYEK